MTIFGILLLPILCRNSARFTGRVSYNFNFTYLHKKNSKDKISGHQTMCHLVIPTIKILPRVTRGGISRYKFCVKIRQISNNTWRFLNLGEGKFLLVHPVYFLLIYYIFYTYSMRFEMYLYRSHIFIHYRFSLIFNSFAIANCTKSFH